MERREVEELVLEIEPRPEPAVVPLEDRVAEGRAATVDGIVVARIVALTERGARIDYPGNPLEGPVEARAMVDLGPEHVGRDVAVAFERARACHPVISGTMATKRAPVMPAPPSVALEDRGEGEPLVLELDRDLEIRCGRASVGLTQSGKILLRGEYVLSEAAGTNRILGGSVRIN